jgi:hypothetical protein
VVIEIWDDDVANDDMVGSGIFKVSDINAVPKKYKF